ncbi:hypothetical protein UFOVP524_12 [uncultured Caudovirales phage]|uniref:Uncharacterized protein n=1 Tax=uncultured Caudovirales phage TaxID=2100421 RepID=A0A6J5MXQ0_9CAUD|nr:hypothetical protein UFOVP524_12 [uncultured Caudovirales phage]CAB4188505.1 hypothetical protein UFOVP1179_39 [uncultured Caudovirales phage]
MKPSITTTPQVLVNEILGSIAWRHLAIADLENLDEDPVDQYSRIKIREALAEAFLAGFARGIENKKGTK